MIFFKKTILFICCAAAVLLNAADVATLHADQWSSMNDEPEILKKLVPTDCYTIKDLDKLMANLQSYKLLLIGSQANYKAKIDFRKYHRQMKDFLSGGGIILLFDANYAETTTMVTGSLVNTQINHRWGCGDMETPGLLNIMPDYRKTLFTFPETAGTPQFPINLRGGHSVDPPAPWRTIARCRCGHSVLLEQSFGKGKIVVTPLFALFSADGKRFTASLVQNLLFRQKCNAAGVEIAGFKVDYKGKQPRFSLTFKNISGKEKRFSGRVVFSGSLIAPEYFDLTLPEGKSFTLYAELKTHSPVTAGVVFEEPFLAFTGKFAPPDLTPESALPDRIFSARTKEFNIRIKHKIKAAFSGAYLIVDGKKRIPCRINNAGASIISADISAVGAGKHTFQIVLTKKENNHEIRLKPQSAIITGKNMKLNVDPRGNLMRNGELFFPMMWYHVSLAEGVTWQSKMECLEFTAKYGYNSIFILSDGRKEDDFFMKEAAKHNIAVFCDNREHRILLEKKDLWDAVVSWEPQDEPEHWGYTPEDVRKRAAKTFAADPRCPIFSSMETAHTVKRYAGVTDIFATHGYPVGVCGLDLVSRKMRLLTDLAKEYMFVPIGTVQCFGYPGKPATGYTVIPTPRQVRNMTYQALAANIKGITWYTFSDGGFHLPDEKPLYELMKTLPREVKVFIPFIQQGKYFRLDCGNRNVCAARWILGENVLEVYINMSDKPQQVKVSPVPGLKPLFQSRAVSNTLTLAPEETILWRK